MFENNKYYTFPTPEELKDVSVEKYRELGFRVLEILDYMKQLMQYFDGKVDLEKNESK